MADRELVQMAHDVLHSVIVREVDLGLSDAEIAKLHVAHDVVSWVLNGACRDAFHTILKALLLEARKRGYDLVSIQ
jgi:hypothetical protein